MAKTKFITFLQKHLVDEINKYLREKKALENIFAEEEYSIKIDEKIKSTLDIAIFNAKDHGITREQSGPNSIIAIELEYLSSDTQILLNYSKFKEYIDNKEKRKGVLIHLFSSEANISKSKLQELISIVEQDNDEIIGFLCEVGHFDISDHRQYKKEAEKLFKNRKFKIALNKALKKMLNVKI